MIDRGSIQAAADDVVAAALLDEGWDAALTRFAHAAGARDAVLMRNTAHSMVVGVATEEAAETVAAFAAGRAPPNSRYAQVKVDPTGGFRIDHDDYTDEQLARDPFYQEFLRPVGVFWHANAILSSGPNEHVELSLKRRVAAGRYERSHVVALDTVLPVLRAAARIARGTLDAEVRGMKRLLRHRGKTIVELDGRGRVIARQAIGETDPASPLRVVVRRLTAANRAEQPRLDLAIEAALLQAGQMTLAPLTGTDGRHYALQIHPIPSRARDIFLAAKAVASAGRRSSSPCWRACGRRPAATRFNLHRLRNQSATAGTLAPAAAEGDRRSPDTGASSSGPRRIRPRRNRHRSASAC